MKNASILNKILRSLTNWNHLKGSKKMSPRVALMELLNDVKDLLFKHDNTSWDGLSPAEVGMDLEIVKERLEKNQEIDKDYLVALFAPTGPIQECAMANDWSEIYLKLADNFDKLIKKL